MEVTDKLVQWDHYEHPCNVETELREYAHIIYILLYLLANEDYVRTNLELEFDSLFLPNGTRNASIVIIDDNLVESDEIFQLVVVVGTNDSRILIENTEINVTIANEDGMKIQVPLWHYVVFQCM